MKFRNPVNDILGQQSKLRILRYLVTTGLELNGRQIAADVGISPPTGHQALKELAESGVLIARNIGHMHLYRLNEESYLVTDVLRPLFRAEQGALDAAMQQVLDLVGDQATSILLYGSAARGEEGSFSDVDLLIVAPTAGARTQVERRLAEQAVSFTARFGNMLSPLILTDQQFRERYQAGDPLLAEIVKSGRLIYGTAVHRLLASLSAA